MYINLYLKFHQAEKLFMCGDMTRPLVVTGQRNPYLRTASTATLEGFPLIDEEELIIDQVWVVCMISKTNNVTASGKTNQIAQILLN